MAFNMHPATTQVKNPFNGHLNPNEVYSTIFNMIISQDVLVDNFTGGYSKLLETFKVDSGLFGDTKLFYASDTLDTEPWNGDLEATDLLKLHRAADPKCQAITINVFRKVAVTSDNYLSKRAWATEGAFAQFTASLKAKLYEAKRCYEETMINAYVGTVETGAAINELVLTMSSATGEEKNRMDAMIIGQGIADLMDNLRDYNTEYNDYGFLRSYDKSKFITVWNAAYINKIRRVDLPTIFHNEGIVDNLDSEKLPSKYFGDVQTTAGTVSASSKERALKEMDCYSSRTHSAANKIGHVKGGQLLPVGTMYEANETYVENSKIICKLVHKDAIKFMGAFEVATAYFNSLSLTTNDYLIFGHSEPDYLRAYPIITIKEA